jgi:alginate O-acetyltransferase complex protein AlgI
MLFNSLSFLVFFPVVTALYFLLPHRYRWLLLLVASCIFYMVFIPAYILILALLIVIDYFACIWIEQSQGRRRKTFLLLSILSVCLALFAFKYINFINSNLRALAGFLHWNYPIGVLRLILPLGLSFHTFQSLSCVIEVYKGRQKAERNFGIYALYVMFYPQLVAGPIERPQHLLHQFHEVHDFEYRRVTDGLKLMLWGFFKKVVIADRLAALVNPVYDNPVNQPGISLMLATFFFAFQIYCDFSGYSDIAIGAAQVMGFGLVENFRRPYFARSVSEFWRRWHISLSTWFRDYVYIPLGGNRVSRSRHYFNLSVTFLISGLWHGANWTFIVWGALHGLYVLAETATVRIRNTITHAAGLNRVPVLLKSAQASVTFALVTFAWIFFRAKSVQQAWYISAHLFTGFGDLPQRLLGFLSSRGHAGLPLPGSKQGYAIAIALIMFLGLVQFVQRSCSARQRISQGPIWLRWTAYYGLVLAILLLGVFENRQFIYFQF